MSRELQDRPYTAWQLIKAYWQSGERLSAYIFLFSVLLMSMVIVGIDVLFTDWYNDFYDALQEYNKSGAIELLWVFCFLATVYIVIAVYQFYLQMYLGLRWRRWLTKQYLTRWLANRSYYHLEHFDTQTDNPDQRIQEDISSLVTSSLDLVNGLLTSVATILAFIYILWTLSGTITLPLGHYGTLHIHGYLVWVSVIYAFVGTLLTYKIGRPLVSLNFEQQKREANFRYAAVDLRMHSENVALYRGEHHQKTVLNTLLDRLLSNWYMIILRQKLLLWFTAGYNQVAVLVPIVVALPNYFNKVFKLGGWMQTLSAFTRIQNAFSFIVNSYSRIAEWQAICERLITFLNHIHEIENEVHESDFFSIRQNSENKIVVKDVSINTPRDEKLLANISQEFLPGKNYWLKGMSGIGKSTFVRAMAGIWPYGSGEIAIPNDKQVMFVPQKTYMPLGTLKEALLFPDKISNISDAELKQLLQECGLVNLVDQLHVVKPWSETLSPGELQRVAFVRVFIHKPDYVFLDESTSALDLGNEKKMYELLKEKLPHCCVISVGHRPSLSDYHEKEIDMTEYSAAVVA